MYTAANPTFPYTKQGFSGGVGGGRCLLHRLVNVILQYEYLHKQHHYLYQAARHSTLDEYVM